MVNLQVGERTLSKIQQIEQIQNKKQSIFTQKNIFNIDYFLHYTWIMDYRIDLDLPM